MAEMQVVENGLVPVYAGENGDRLVDARELHEFIQSGWKWSEWIQDRIRRCDLIDGVEFFRENRKTPSGGRPSVEYWLTLDAAKEIAMVENNEQGKRVRRYFIDVEKKARVLATTSANLLNDPDFLVELATRYRDERHARMAAEAKVQELAPKADFHDQVSGAVNCVEIGAFAKALGKSTGPVRFFRWLKAEKILMSNNLPYQQYIDAGYFKVEERTRNGKEGQTLTYFVTMVTGSGQTYLQKRWVKSGNAMQMHLEAN